MSWFSQFSLLMRSSVTTIRERIEDPERMLHQLIIDMEQELDRVRASVAEAIADEIQMRRRTDRERQEAEKWHERAASAMKRNDEAASRSALDQKLAAEQRADRWAEDHAKQFAEVEKLQRSVHDLEEKIRQANQRKTLLLARMSRAVSCQKIHTAMDRANSQSAFAQFNRLEHRVEREEALSEAWDRMEGHDPEIAELESQFDAQERADLLEKELAKLRSQVNG